jgi:flagellar hook-associated protein 1 FlgK
MTTLSSALSYALSGLSVAAAQSAIVSRNVSFAGDENYTRKYAEILTLPGGAPAISSTSRNMDKQLFVKLLGSTSNGAGQQVTLEAVKRLSATVGDPEADGSIAAMLGGLQNSLRTYEINPSNSSLAAAALESARRLVIKLNETSAEVLAIRGDAERAMSQSVEHINTLLAQFKVVNDSIVRGSGTASDLAENLDQRDSILKLLSEEIGIRLVSRPNNDVMIYAEGGTVLFEGSPRSVSMAPTSVFDPATKGQAVFVDGVAVTGGLSPMPIAAGKLAAMAGVRDELTLTMQRQVDEIASGLIRSFAEKDQSAVPVLPDVAGLFVDSAGGLPVAGTWSPGLASRIAINALADPQRGGTPALIRDGGFGGASYVYNQESAAGYQARISELIASFDLTNSFDPESGLSASASLGSYGLESASWVEARRQAAQAGSEAASAIRVRANETLQRVTGVNIDQEMAALLDLEKSYQASSKVIAVIDAMLSTLLEAVG